MPADAYIPEPDIDDAPIATLEPRNGLSHDTPMATPLATALVQWSAQRQVVKEFLRRELHSGVDYYALQIKGRDTKPVLSKAGSEKVLGLLQLAAHFALDEATWTMLGKPEGTLCYVCTLTTTAGHIVGEGRGARRLTQDGGDLNKTIKMAQKSAQVDAVLRTGALSDCFTQDLEDEQPPTPTGKSQDLRSQIWAIIKQRAPEVTGREDAARWVKEHTKLELHPDHYQAILAAIEGR